MDSYHRRKKILEEKYGKLINVRPYNDDIGIAERAIAAHRKQQNYVKQ